MKSNSEHLANCREYYKANRQRILARKRQYYASNRTLKLEKQKEYYADNVDAQLAYQARHRATNKARIIAYDRLRRNELKSLVFEAYGGACRCCDITDNRFLTVDHINERPGKLEGSKKLAGGDLYRFLVKNNFPTDNYQLLCWNCNITKSKFGGCPHKEAVSHD